jgi:ankyrin repeat protein
MNLAPNDLFRLVKTCDLHEVEIWVNGSTRLNCTDDRGMTPLHWAARLGKTEVAAFLVGLGADVHALDRDGKSPLLLAAEAGQVAVALVLLEKGASPAVRAKTSETALHLAVRCESLPYEDGQRPRDSQGMVELLAEYKYLLDYRLPDGRTAVMITAADDNAGMMRALLKAGADPLLADNRGLTATDCARETGADGSLQVLLADEAAREARGGLTKQVLVGPALKLKIPKI